MKLARALVVSVLACSGGFARDYGMGHIILIRQGGDVGSSAARIPITFVPDRTFTYRIEMHSGADGMPIDESFDGWVRLSVKPGSVYGGRNVQLHAGVADAVPITLIAAYGDTHIWVEDIGYIPVADLNRDPPPACANGIDDDQDGTIDFPADPGCLATNDDTEGEGDHAAGVSETIFYAYPRVADVQGAGVTQGTATPFPKEQVRLDTGYDPSLGKFSFDVVVTRIASDGFNVTDVQDQQGRGYASIYAFTFSAPQKLRVCDRLRALSGTAVDFYGFTELSFPTFTAEFYDPRARPCLVPEPRVFSAAEAADTKTLFRWESGLVRLLGEGSVTVHIGTHFGPGKPKAPAYAPEDNATNCDLNNSGKVDFQDTAEATCATACQADNECTEFSSFRSQSNFSFVVSDPSGPIVSKIQGNASASAEFDPVLNRGKPIHAFTGNLRYFSGGNQFTIEARCGDDIVVDASKSPLSSDKACVRPRTDSELDGN